MKKFYLLAAAMLVAGASQAAGLSFLLGESPIANGEEVTYTDYKVENYEEDVDVLFEPHMYLTADYATGPVTLTAVCTSGQKIQICAGGDCVDAANVEKKLTPLAANEKLDLQFHYTAMQVLPDAVASLKECVTVLSASDDNDAAISTTCTVIFSTNNSGIKSIEYGKNVAVANGRIAYSVNGAESLRVYSLSGNTVVGATVEGNGTVDVNHLAPGIYVYTLGNASGKFIVR